MDLYSDIIGALQRMHVPSDRRAAAASAFLASGHQATEGVQLETAIAAWLRGSPPYWPNQPIPAAPASQLGGSGGGGGDLGSKKAKDMTPQEKADFIGKNGLDKWKEKVQADFKGTGDRGISRAAFESLSPRERMAHVMAGGIVTDGVRPS